MEGICNPGTNVLKEMPFRNPTDGTFELTVRCNLHCKMCLFRHDDSENSEICKNELTAEQWIDLAQQAADAGTLSLLITGGEAMLRPDFCEIYEGIYKIGFFITLYTNATLVTPKIMETLRKYPPHKIGITIYGASPETYLKVCGSADAFERMIEGVKQLQTLPSVIDFRTTIIKDNLKDLPIIEKIIQNEFHSNAQLTQTRMVMPAVRGGFADVVSCRLDPKENVLTAYNRGIELIKETVGDKFSPENVKIKHIDPANNTKEDVITLFGCNAGMSMFTITWDGKLIGCQLLDYFYVDVKEKTFATAWKEYPTIVHLPPLNEECQKCEKSYLCNCCYATRYAETGKLNGKPEYVCEDTEVLYNMMM